MDTWQMIREERASLVDALAELDDTAWRKPSLCAGWTVRDVVGHMIGSASMTPAKFFGKMTASGFSFQRMTRRDIRRYTTGRTNAELVEALRARIPARTAPPGPTVTWLGETVIHGEDVFRALGDYRKHSVEHVIPVADFCKTSNLLSGTKNRIAGLTLRATDADWQHGTGPEVSGPAIALLLAMTGRKAALDDLHGDGVSILRNRN